MKALLRSRLTWLSTLTIVVLCAAVALAALFDEETEVEDLFNQSLYNHYMAYQARSVSDIVTEFEWQQVMFLPILVPDPDFIHIQAGGILAFDPNGFPNDFLKGLVPVDQGGITMYPITVYEDPQNRERVILNARDQKIGGQYAPWSYDPQWYIKERYPNLSTLDSGYAAWLAAMYDPSRIVITYNLILEDDLIKYVWKQSIDAALRAEEEEEGGGMMRSSWEGGTVSNLQFVAIDKQSNGCVSVSLAYPDSYMTNSAIAFEIFTCDGGEGLIDFWWELGTVTNVDTSTNFVEWIDTESSNSYANVRFYAAAVSNDVDGDGFTDGYERFVSHTVVTNSNSYPVVISGTLSYSGPQDGLLWMVAVTESNKWFGSPVSIESPGDYTNSTVGVGTSYWFKAFRDSNENTRREAWEAQGVYAATSMYVSADITNVNITLTDPDDDSDNLPDWWEMLHFDDLDETASGDPDGDNLVNSDEYTQSTDPTDADTDDDNMGDGAEIANSLSPTTSNTYYSLPFAEGFETNTVNPSSYYLRGQNGWSDSPAYIGMIQNSQAQDGDYGLQIFGYESQPRVHHYFGAIEHDVVWVDLWQQPLLRAASAAPSLDNAASVVFYMNTNANVVVRNGTSWETVTNHPAIGEDTWVRFTTKQNFATETWDLWLEGQEIATNLDFAASAVEFSRFRATGGNPDYAYVDSLLISTSHPPNSVSGTTTYGGGQTGDILVVAVSASNAWDLTYSTSLSTCGAYQLNDMPDWSACWMKAFRDSDGDETWDSGEAWGSFTSNPVSLATAFDLRNVDILLSDPDADSDGMPDWWESEHGLSTTNSSDAVTDPDSDGLNNLAEYQADSDPNDKDSDGDGLVDGTDGNMSTNSYPQGADADTDGWVDGEADVVYGCNPILFDTDADGLVDGCDGLISVASYPTGTDSNANGYVDGEVDYGTSSTNADTDADGCLDGWEVAHGYDPLDDTDPALTADPDQDGLTNLEEAQNNTDPTDTDTDDDGMGDWAEVANSLSPTVSNTFYALPFSEGFETNTATAGSLNGQNGWSSWPTNRVLVVETNAQSGTQALQLGESYHAVGAEHFIAAHGETNIWIDFYMQVDPANTVNECRHPDVSGDLTWPPSLFVVNDRSQVVAYDGSGTGMWETASNTVVSASGYHRYTIKQDYSASTWDLYFDGTNVLNGMGFQDNGIVEFSRFSVAGQWIGETYLDSVSVGTSKPSGLTP